MSNGAANSNESDGTGRARDRNLAIQTAFVGDLLLSVPLLKGVRALHPDRELWLLCRKGLGRFAERAGLVDRAIEVDKGAGSFGWESAREHILSRSFETIYCAHESFRTAFFVARIEASRRVGFRRSWNAFAFDDRVVRPMELPDALRQLSLLSSEDPDLVERLAEYARAYAPGGLPLLSEMKGRTLARDVDDRGPETRLTRETLRLPEVPGWASMEVPHFSELHRTRGSGAEPASPEVRGAAERLGMRAFGRAGKQTVFMAPGSVWPTKRWRPEGFSELARELLAKGWNVVLFGAPDEAALAEEIRHAAPGVLSVVGELGIFEACELLALGDLLVSNDSGAAHMAALSGLPTVAAFGPTTLDQGYRPWNSHAAVAQVDLACRPCGKHGARVCPLATHACMRDLGVEDFRRAMKSVST